MLCLVGSELLKVCDVLGRQLRVAAYNTLTLWLRTSKCGSCVELISEQLVPVVMQDIWFEKEAVTLNVSATCSMWQCNFCHKTYFNPLITLAC